MIAFYNIKGAALKTQARARSLMPERELHPLDRMG